MSISKTKVSELYVSVFGRAAEGEGANYWSGLSGSTADIANSMFSLSVVRDYFGVSEFTSEASVRQVVETIYLNTLNKSKDGANGTEFDADGIQYWIDTVVVDGGSMGDMIASLVHAARDSANAGAAQDTFVNKVAVSEYSADHLFSFSTFALFQDYIADVNEGLASVTSAKSFIDSIEGGTFTLPSEGTFSLQFNTGTNGDDSLISLGVDNTPVLLGFEGNDALHSGAGDKLAVLLGGDGDDQYYLEGLFGTYLVIDSAGGDTLHIPGSSDDIEAIYTVDNGQTLVVYADDVDVILPNWKNADNQIETFVFSDTSLSYNDVVGVVTAQSEGDFPVSRLIELPGVTTDAVNSVLEVVVYLSDLGSEGFENVMNIDLTGIIGSEALSDFIF